MTHGFSSGLVRELNNSYSPCRQSESQGLVTDTFCLDETLMKPGSNLDF